MKKNWSNANDTACWLLVLALVTGACREKTPVTLREKNPQSVMVLMPLTRPGQTVIKSC